MKKLLAVLLLMPSLAWAQATTNTNLGYWSTSGCPTGFSPCFKAYDTSGAGPPVTATLQAGSATIGKVDITGTTTIAPIVSASLENAHVLKNAAGTLWSVYASNLTGGTASNLLILNATASPGDGAVTPLVCVPFLGGVASANYQGIPPAAFSTGITAVVSSAASCFTKTTGVTTAFISGIIQ